MTCGIYKLNFTGTDMVYIGLSDNIERRFIGHKYNFRHSSSDSKLQNAYNMYGLPSIEILCECEQEELDKYEIEAIEIFNSIDNGFNTRNGGTTGNTNLYGDRNNRAKYSNEQIISAFKLLLENKYTQKEISNISGVSVQAISHISAGTGHTWLANKFPEEYTEFRNSKANKSKDNNLNIIIINTDSNAEYLINSYEDIINLTNCKYSTAVAFVSGYNKSLFNVWKLKEHKNNTTNKKPIYEFCINNECIITSSISGFFKAHNLININKFKEFVKDENNIGSKYQGILLKSIIKSPN